MTGSGPDEVDPPDWFSAGDADPDAAARPEPDPDADGLPDWVAGMDLEGAEGVVDGPAEPPAEGSTGDDTGIIDESTPGAEPPEGSETEDGTATPARAGPTDGPTARGDDDADGRDGQPGDGSTPAAAESTADAAAASEDDRTRQDDRTREDHGDRTAGTAPDVPADGNESGGSGGLVAWLKSLLGL